jgi:hypothetical protein
MARDPMSPPFHVNLCYGLRFLQLSVLVSQRSAPGSARALPVRFDPAPPARKPKKNAAAELWQAYRQQKKQQSLPEPACRPWPACGRVWMNAPTPALGS